MTNFNHKNSRKLLLRRNLNQNWSQTHKIKKNIKLPRYYKNWIKLKNSYKNCSFPTWKSLLRRILYRKHSDRRYPTKIRPIISNSESKNWIMLLGASRQENRSFDEFSIENYRSDWRFQADTSSNVEFATKISFRSKLLLFKAKNAATANSASTNKQKYDIQQKLEKLCEILPWKIILIKILTFR